LHLIRFHGVLAPNAKLRPLGVPQCPEGQEQATDAAVAAECEVEAAQARPRRISWARLLKRVFDIDMQHCPNCGNGTPPSRLQHHTAAGAASRDSSARRHPNQGQP
jgi:hypothetical protein